MHKFMNIGPYWPLTMLWEGHNCWYLISVSYPCTKWNWAESIYL